MKICMSPLVRKQCEIFNSVIVSNFIYMMYNFSRLKISFNMLFHDKAVFRNPTLVSSVWVFWRKHFNVTSAIFYSSSNPITIFRTFIFSFHTYTYPELMLLRELFPKMSLAQFKSIFSCSNKFSTNSFKSPAHFFFRFFRQLSSYFCHSVTSRRTIPCSKFFSVRKNPKMFFTYYASFFNHMYLQLKSPCSACLKVTVKLLTHTKGQLVDIKNLLPSSNYSLSQCY
jgi:hypothetical protein